jgi:hypothetical protein
MFNKLRVSSRRCVSVRPSHVVVLAQQEPILRFFNLQLQRQRCA